MEGLKFKTPLAEFEIKNGIVYSKFVVVSATLERAQEHVRIIKETLAPMAPFLAITDISNSDRNATKEVRDCLNDKEMERLNKATALIANSMLTRMAGNLFIRFSSVAVPVAFFSNEADALKWIEEHR